MKYSHIVEGRFIERPNRFIAYVNIEGRRGKSTCKKYRPVQRAVTRQCTGLFVLFR